jgi:Leucine-rich repeat (LRR) protein/serine/threonine protein kinase
MAMKAATILLLLLHLALSFDLVSTAVGPRRRRKVLLQERNTLLALKRGLTLPSPSALADWNESNGHVCGFTGVTCDRWREHVVGLALVNMSISGVIPAVVGELARLRSIDVSNNSISGGMPPSLGNLTHLESLVVRSNRISGTIPLVFGNLLRLQNVDAANNLISGAVPSVLGNLLQLQNLDLSNNNISGAIPSSIGNLTRLENLYMFGNHISGAIPPAIGNLTSLLNLDVSSNLLTGQIPVELSKLRNLGTLDFGNNQLRGGIPPTLASLTAMYYLSLEHNYLSGPIPEAIFLNCTILGVTELGDNDLSGEIPRAASGTLAETFAVVNLYSNKLTGTLPRWLANCTILLMLDVENNSLADELPTSIISGKKYLKYLHLSNNRFWSHDGNSNLEPFFAALSNCSWIEEVEAGAVGMGGRLPCRLGKMLPRNIWHLNLEMNSIEGPIPVDIGDVINMTLMNLSSNMLNGTIPTSLCGLPGLQQLSLSNNILTGEIPPCIGNATRLGELDLSGNALSGTIPSSIGSLTQLTYLVLQRNRLSGEIPASLGRCASLMRLDLSSNQLAGEVPEQVAGIVKMTLNLSLNQLEGELPRSLSKLQQVQTIDLSWNNFSGVVFAGIADCVELTVLDLSHNSLAGVLPSSISGMQSLESLDVSNNSLTGEIPVSLTKCSSLKQLNLSYNDFSGIVPATGALARFSLLTYLGNRRLCGSVVRRACGRLDRSWYQSLKFLVILCISAATVAFVLTILCAVSVRKIAPAVREDMFRSRRSGGASPVMKYKYPRITYRELVEATDEFSADRLVGTGSYGRVYRGTLRDGTMVAVKVLQLQSGNSTKSFNRECQVLKRIRHRNLMRIITACSLPDFKALVLPFMANGSLERCLYAGAPAELSLLHRVNICSDIAEGMSYLHHHSPVKVIHCDLKPSNVLINGDMTALVSDFGISRLVMSVGGVVNTADVGASTANMLCGSIGYIPPGTRQFKIKMHALSALLVINSLLAMLLAPDQFMWFLSIKEYGYGSSPTTKGDVYSFGVLVLEMVTRRKPTDDMFEAGMSLHGWVKTHHHGRADVVVDPALARMVQDQTPEIRRMSGVAISELLELGILCTQEQASARPTMMDAADDLDRLKRYIGGETTATCASSLGFSSMTVEDID